MYELHDYARASSAARVRIALALKGLSVSAIDIDLTSGAQHDPEFRALNPQGMVPVYTDERVVLSQSLAIIEYLNERYPDPPLLPDTLVERARARQFAQLVCSDIQPVNGFRVMAFLRDSFKIDTRNRRRWFNHWLLEGLDALELWLTAAGGTSRYCVGTRVSIADICVVPQLDIARRNGLDIEDFPRLAAIEANCLSSEAFKVACVGLHSSP